MTELPALREAVRVTAERHYGRRHRPWIRRAVPGLAWAACAAAIAVGVVPFLARDREVAAPPPAATTAPEETSVPQPAARELPRSLVADDPVVREGIPTGGADQRLVSAWSVPALGGRAYLLQTAGLVCLSVPAGEPVARASGCERTPVFERLGVTVSIDGHDATVSRVSSATGTSLALYVTDAPDSTDARGRPERAEGRQAPRPTPVPADPDSAPAGARPTPEPAP